MRGGHVRREGGTVALMKATSHRSREDEAERGASWSTEETPWRWRACAETLAE